MRDQKNALDRKVKRAARAARLRKRSGPRPRRLTARENKKVKDPDASIRGIKRETMQASGYLTLAAFAKWTRERVRLAHCPRE